AMVDENDRLRKELAKLQQATMKQATGDLIDSVTEIEGIKFIAAEVPADSMDALRAAADRLRDQMKSGVGVLGANLGKKVSFLAFVTDDLVQERSLRADELVREVAKIAGGGGGGKPQLATAGAKDASKLGDAIAKAPDIFAQWVTAKA
ncbi:MAG: alanine--tRNA ligase, partial [Candidatus Eisenbacteria bacterium]|nr:alanine--tRNA ligase [Candidatus Eisenbacteria bacterium]